MATLHVSEVWLSQRDDGTRVGLGESGVYDTGRELCESGALYRDLQREYGRCVGKMYVDTDGRTLAVGWIFQKRRTYDDSPGETFLAETWCTLHTAPDTVTRTSHYYTLGRGLATDV